MNKMKKTKIQLLMKIIAVTIICVMISQLFPSIVVGIQYSNELQEEKTQERIEQEEAKEDTSNQEETKQEEPEEKPVQEANNRTGLQIQDTKEILEKRTLNEKHFLQKDGSIVASVYPMNVHYNSNGKLEDINNSLEEVWRRI